MIRHLSRDAGVPLEDFFTQWLDRPTPSDYSLSPIIPPAGDMPGRIEIRRTAGPWEPLLARARFSDRTIDWWLSGKETETILPLAPGEVPRWVQLDPDQRLSDPDVANNRRPEEWKTLLSRFGARYDFQSRELEYNLSLVATPVYRRDRRLALNLFREEQSSGIRLEYGTNVWKNPAGDLRYDLAVRAGWEKLRKGFGEGDGGNEPLPGPRSDVPLIFSIERTRDGGGSIGLDAEGSSRAVGSSVSYLRGQVAAKREWRIGPYEAVAGRVIFGSASSGIPDQKKFSLGGLEGARGFSKSEILGRQIVLGTGEYRVPIHEDVGLDLLGLLVVDRVQLALFGDAGAATESFDDLGRIGSYRYDLGVGFRMHAAWAGIMPAVLRLDAAYPIGPQNAAGGEPPRRRIHWYLSVGQSF
ncbi:MAG: BamA/TamA family outer membrane protein [Nitrospirae bacterium]|nr:BamA/TamA family outer membrane protein [Nitrospirota bacterium]